MFGVPYLISAVASPFLGILIDKVGKRALMISLSSFLLIVAFTTSLLLPDTQGSKLELIPLVIVGIGYSIYCAAIWGSIPYTVEPNSVGTAFGMTTAIQNIGLIIAPTVVGFIKTNTSKMYGYFWVDIFFIAINVIGLIQNLYLYHIDIKYHDGILNRVDKGEGLADLMTSPTQTRKEILSESMAKRDERASLMQYKLDSESRNELKRSMATRRPN
jgi:MFS family permease